MALADDLSIHLGRGGQDATFNTGLFGCLEAAWRRLCSALPPQRYPCLLVFMGTLSPRPRAHQSLT